MYLCDKDPERGLVVWFGKQVTDAEWLRALGDMDEVLAWAHPGAKRTACVMIPGGLAMPSATARRQLAERMSSPRFNLLLAVVAPSALTRGAMTAISWLRPARHYESEHVASYADARRWLEQRRQEPLPVLDDMIARVLGRARTLSRDAESP